MFHLIGTSITVLLMNVYKLRLQKKHCLERIAVNWSFSTKTSFLLHIIERTLVVGGPTRKPFKCLQANHELGMRN